MPPVLGTHSLRSIGASAHRKCGGQRHEARLSIKAGGLGLRHAPRKRLTRRLQGARASRWRRLRLRGHRCEESIGRLSHHEVAGRRPGLGVFDGLRGDRRVPGPSLGRFNGFLAMAWTSRSDRAIGTPWANERLDGVPGGIRDGGGGPPAPLRRRNGMRRAPPRVSRASRPIPRCPWPWWRGCLPASRAPRRGSRSRSHPPCLRRSGAGPPRGRPAPVHRGGISSLRGVTDPMDDASPRWAVSSAPAILMAMETACTGSMPPSGATPSATRPWQRSITRTGRPSGVTSVGSRVTMFGMDAQCLEDRRLPAAGFRGRQAVHRTLSSLRATDQSGF